MARVEEGVVDQQHCPNGRCQVAIRIRQVIGGVLGCVVLVWLAACHDADPLPVTGDTKARILQRFAVAPYEFYLVIDACRADPDDPQYRPCPLQIELRASGRLLDRYPLAVPSPAAEIVRHAAGPWGAEFGRNVWASSGLSDNSALSTAARIVLMSRGVRGLLVSQQFGFEHLHQYHVLLLPQRNQLLAAWVVDDQFTYASAARTDAVPSSTLGFVRVQFNFGVYLEPPGADRVEMWQVLWNETLQRVEEVPLPRPGLPLYLVTGGAFASAAAATTASREMLRCQHDLRSVDPRNHPGLGLDTIALGEWYVHRSQAKAAARALDTCEPTPAVRLYEYGYPAWLSSAPQSSHGGRPELVRVPL